jgi:hypothetical protein
MEEKSCVFNEMADMPIILWRADPLLGNDRKISNYTMSITDSGP